MKKLLLWALLLASASFSWADSKVSALTQDTTTQVGDLIYKVDNPSGTPQSRSITVGNLIAGGLNPATTYFVQINPPSAQSGSFNIGGGSVTDVPGIFILGTGGSTNSKLFPSFVNLPRSSGIGPQNQDIIWYGQMNQDSGISGSFSMLSSTSPPNGSGFGPTANQGNSQRIRMDPIGGANSEGQIIFSFNSQNKFTITPSTFTSTLPFVLSSYDCSGNTNSGKLTANSNGVVTCADDISGGGGSGTPATVSVATGSPMGFNTAISSPVASVLFSTQTFQVQLQGAATAYVTTRSTITSDGVPEGTSNLYYTGTRAGQFALSLATGSPMGYNATISSPTKIMLFSTTTFQATVLGGATTYINTVSTLTTTGIPEGTNLYYTGTRAGAFAVSLATGSAMGFNGTISSPTAIILLSTTNFQAQLQGGTTNFITYRSTLTSDGVPQGSTNLYVTSANVNGLGANTSNYILNGTSLQTPPANFFVNNSSSTRVFTSSLSVVGGAEVSTLTVRPLLDNTTAFTVINSSGVNVFTLTTSTPLAGDAQFQIVIDTRSTYAMKVGTATLSGPYLVFIATSGHVNYEGGVNPTISSCGTSPTINPNCTDMGCTVTPGATAAGCTFTFGTPFSKIPNCIVQEQAFSLTNAPSYTVTRTAVTLTETALTSIVTFLCSGAD